jgi:hypothetical protein
MEMIEYEHHHHHVFGGVEELVIKTSWLFRIDTTNTNKYIYIQYIYIMGYITRPKVKLFHMMFGW